MNEITAIESKDINPPDRVEIEKKDLSQYTSRELSNVLNELISHVENSEDMTDDEKSIVEKINASAESKALALGYVIKQIKEAQEIIEHENKHHKKKIDDNNKRVKVLQGRIDSRMFFLNDLMVKISKKKIEGPNIKVRLKKMRDKLLINPDANHTRYYHLLKMVPTSFNWDLKKAKEWAKNNESGDFKLVVQPSKLEVL